MNTLVEPNEPDEHLGHHGFASKLRPHPRLRNHDGRAPSCFFHIATGAGHAASHSAWTSRRPSSPATPLHDDHEVDAERGEHRRSEAEALAAAQALDAVTATALPLRFVTTMPKPPSSSRAQTSMTKCGVRTAGLRPFGPYEVGALAQSPFPRLRVYYAPLRPSP